MLISMEVLNVEGVNKMEVLNIEGVSKRPDHSNDSLAISIGKKYINLNKM